MTKFLNKKLLLIDGSSYLYRAYYAFPSLINSTGDHIGVIHGVLNMLRSLMIRYQPNYMAVIFDAKGKTFRNKLFKDYKSHRRSMPMDLFLQISPLQNIIKAMGIRIMTVAGVEADDVIGTIAISICNTDHHVLIITKDKDMAQLVSPGISLLNTVTSTVVGEKEVLLKFGVPPSLIIDYLALIGDSSDNIPGVPGIGIKTAQLLLQKIGGLKTIYQNLDKINTINFNRAKNIVATLDKYRNIAFLSYQLATIKTDVSLNLSFEEFKIIKPEFKLLNSFLQRYKFKKLMNICN